jgi:hypothetical protein
MQFTTELVSVQNLILQGATNTYDRGAPFPTILVLNCSADEVKNCT